jgi:hypothetical protein
LGFGLSLGWKETAIYLAVSQSSQIDAHWQHLASRFKMQSKNPQRIRQWHFKKSVTISRTQEYSREDGGLIITAKHSMQSGLWQQENSFSFG